MKKALSIVVILTITAILLEGTSWIVLRIFSSQPDPIRSETHLFDANKNHRLNPAFQFSQSSKSRIHSPDGFRRNASLSIVKPKNTIRIVVLGTSALYGAGASAGYPKHRPLYNDETVTFYLEQDLQKRLDESGEGYRVEVVNAGVSATKTFHHLIRMNSSLLEYSPDIVLNLDGHNDFYTDIITDRWSSYTYSTHILVDEFNGRTPFLAGLTFVRTLAPYLSFFNLLEKVFKRFWYTTKVKSNSLPHTGKKDFGVINGHQNDIAEVARRSYIRDLWQIHVLGAYAGYDHAVFLQPEVVFEKKALLSEQDVRMQEVTEALLGEDAVELMGDVRAMLPKLFKGAGIPYHDVGEIASPALKKEQLYIDYCHLSPAGAAVLAQKMADFVFPVVQKRLNSVQ